MWAHDRNVVPILVFRLAMLVHRLALGIVKIKVPPKPLDSFVFVLWGEVEIGPKDQGGIVAIAFTFGKDVNDVTKDVKGTAEERDEPARERQTEGQAESHRRWEADVG